MTAEEKRLLDRKVEQMLAEAGIEPGMTFEQVRDRLQKAGFDEHSAARWADFHVEAYEQAHA